MAKKKCLFCGADLKEKSKEHILPQWLLKMTGDPKRVVDIGLNYKTGKPIRFDWSSFVSPACQSCNSRFSNIENRAKGYVEKLLERQPLTSYEYNDFLNWIDKVRIGSWLALLLIQQNPSQVNPNFYINTRIASKDRMIAIYPINSDEMGLNIFGTHTIIFENMPSCFALKINNILILNMSCDFLFSGRCGFPFPRKFETLLDGEDKGKMGIGKIMIKRRIMHPLMRKKIFKPSIHLYQPMMFKDQDGNYPPNFHDDSILSDPFFVQHTMKKNDIGKGVLFRQHTDRVDPIFDFEAPIPFQDIVGKDSKPMYELISQVYKFQNFLYENKAKYKTIDKDKLISLKRLKRTMLRQNKAHITYYMSMRDKGPNSMAKTKSVPTF